MNLKWEAQPNGVWKAALDHAPFTGLFANGKRLTRARYPNCPDITGTDCYLLNASGATSNPKTPTAAITDIPGGINLEVKNEHGVDMFADTSDSAQAYGPHGASGAIHT